MECGAPDCTNRLEPKRSTARYCGPTCRQRAARARKAAAESVEADAESGKAEHQLVRAVRAELETLGKVDTFNGQLAMQLARRLANPEESGATALSKELRAVMADAIGKPPPDPEPAGGAEPTENEVERARRKREEARQAAGIT